MRGALWAEVLMEGRPVEWVNGYRMLFAMLHAGRIDAALCSDNCLEVLPEEAAALYGNVRKLDPPVSVTPLYHSLNRKHERLAPTLEKVLRELSEREGWHDTDKKHKPLPPLGSGSGRQPLP